MNKTEIKLYCFASSWWDSLSKQQQEKYLKQHPKSKRKVTALDKIEAPTEDNWISPDLMFISGDQIKSNLYYQEQKSKLRHITADNDSYLYDDTVPLSQEDILNVVDYTGAGYSNINKFLRDELPFFVDKKELHDKVKALCNIIDKQPSLSKDRILFRGMTIPEDSMYKEGETYENPSFLSVTANPLIAANFSAREVENYEPTMLQLKVKKGHKLLYIPNVARQKGARDIHIPVYEKEAVLKPKTKFKVLKVEKTEKGTIVHAEVI